jgi:hypothetical protein
MLDSTFAPQAYETEYPTPPRASARVEPFASARTLDLDLSVVSRNGPAFDGKLRCEPGEDQQTHVFHWLVFAVPSPKGKEGASTACDLWRWHRGEWRSVFVAGASFTPEEMYAQGWRYCVPSVQLYVNFVSAPKEHSGGAGRPQARAKRNRSLSLAVSAPARRGAIASA